MTRSDREGGVDVLVDVPIVFDVDAATTVHSPMVQAVVGGVPTRLILDTGSTDHVLTKELIDRVGAPMTPGEEGTDHAGAPVPSWFVGELEVGIGGRSFALQDVVAIAGLPPFAGWGMGGFLSPQHLHPTARIMIDLFNDRFVVAGSQGADVDAFLTALVPTLRPLTLDRVPGDGTVDVRASIEPFAVVATVLNTGGRQTEFAASVIKDDRGVAEGQGTGLSGTRVLGADAGARILRVGDARIPIPRLVVRDEMEGLPGLVGMDVLRGTALVCSSDADRGVVWLVPR